MKLSWLTDIHLNFLDDKERLQFYQNIVDSDSDAVLITGDIAEASSTAIFLNEMAEQIKQPIYFVLGNHDYYRGAVDAVRKKMADLTQKNNLLYWLPSSGPQQLSENTILLGQDSWADGRYGDFANSGVTLNDSRMIQDLFQAKISGKYALLDKMQALADQDAQQLHQDLLKAIKQYNPKKIIVLIHVPPFKEACLFQGKISDDDHLPYFGSKAIGDVLLTVAQHNPNINFLVLCGHTHEKAEYQARENLHVRVGEAEYGAPKINSLAI